MPESYGMCVIRRMCLFYFGAFAIIAIFSLLFAFKYNPLFLILTFLSTALVIVYCSICRCKVKFKTTK